MTASRRRETTAGASGELARVRALAHPLRFRIFQEFAGRRRTTRQVAAILGEPPTRLYHHVNLLERVGLLRLVETRPNRGTTEKYFEAVGAATGRRRAAPGAARTGHRERAALATLVFDEARLELLAAMEARRSGRRAVDESVTVARVLLPGSPARVARLRRDILALVRRHTRETLGSRGPARLPEGADHWSLTLAILPRPGRRDPSAR